MSVGPLGGLAASAAGSPLAQAHGSEVDRARQDAAAQQRKAHSDQKAEDAAGIGQTDGDDHEAEDRDADGRRLWEEAPGSHKDETDAASPDTPRSKDPSGASGNLLDLSG
ncbi:MAG: hypothetical protein RBS80_10560 [Thermoguttaceae bacterium]|jgi:hypothetical protein|nr:hypothetical protein [Thermoguttaceae bacterium]